MGRMHALDTAECVRACPSQPGGPCWAQTPCQRTTRTHALPRGWPWRQPCKLGRNKRRSVRVAQCMMAQTLRNQISNVMLHPVRSGMSGGEGDCGGVGGVARHTSSALACHCTCRGRLPHTGNDHDQNACCARRNGA